MCVSLVTSEGENLFIYSLAIWIFFVWSLLPIFHPAVSSFFICGNSLYFVDTSPLLIFFWWGGGACRAACGILVPWPGIEPTPSVVKAKSPTHWTAREFPLCWFLCCKHLFPLCLLGFVLFFTLLMVSFNEQRSWFSYSPSHNSLYFCLVFLLLLFC